MKKQELFKALLVFICGLYTPALYAQQPRPWQMSLQDAATPAMRHIVELHDFLMIVITCIAVFVTIMMAVIVFRFRATRNPIPSQTTHNVLLEVIWTLIPVIILAVMALPSWRLTFFLDKTTDPELTLKVTGKMWLWGYEYPEHEISFDSAMLEENALQEGQLRLLDVDNYVVIPVETNVRLLFTAADVIHSWAVPSFGIKKDCVPGRLNESWVRVDKEGTYYGQCSEICGKRHGFMPIGVKAVSKEAFAGWLAQQKQG